MVYNGKEADSKQNRIIKSSFRKRIFRENKSSFAFVASVILGGLILFLTSRSVHAQMDVQPIVPFTHLTVADGLPNNTIRAIHQDDQGFMWFGTDDGLSRYDGYHFVTYKHEQDNPDSIASNQVRDIFEDSDGYLWVGTWNGGVSRFDAKTETFTNYQSERNNPNSLSFNIVTAVTQDSNHHFWFGGPPETGLNHFDPLTETFTHYRPHVDYRGEGISDLAADEFGGVWLATNEGASRFDNRQFAHYPTPAERHLLTTILEDSAGQWWFGGMSGLFRFDMTAEQLLPVPDSPPSILTLLEDKNGLFWVGTQNGLFLFNPRQETWQLFARHDPLFADSLSQDHILSLFEDAAGNVWIGTNEGGVNMFNPQQTQFANYRHDPTDEATLAQGTVWAVTGDEDRLWVATSDVLSEWVNGRFYHYPLPEGSGRVTALQTSQNGTVWVGTDETQFFRFDPEKCEFTPYTLTTSGAPPTVQMPITAIVEDESGIVWLAVLRDALHRFDPADGTDTVFRVQGGIPGQFVTDPQSIGNRLVHVLAAAPDGTIWIGYESAGMSRLDPQTNRFTHYLPQPGIGPVEALYPAPDGLVWAATRWGLARFDPQTETAVLYTEADGLPSSYSVGLLADRQGYLWVSTLNGLARFDPQGETFQQYGVSDGLLSGDFSPRATWFGEDGRFYLGSNAGITAFYPEQVALNPYQPPIALTELRLFNEPVPIGAESLLTQAIEQTEQLTLAYDDDIISFEFAALSFAAPEENRYRYRLEGLEEEWNEVGSDRRFATYTNLVAGDYILRVQGSNEDGVWSEAEAAVQITVLPPWWETLWFRGLVVVVVIGLVYGGFRWRVVAIERRNRELEAEVARQTAVVREAESQKQRLAVLEERQRIGRELHDDLGQVLGYVNVQSQAALAQMTQKDDVQLQTTLTQMAQVARDAHADVRQYILGIRTGESERLPDPFIPTLKKYLQDLATLYNLETGLSLPPEWDVDDDNTSYIFSTEVETQLLRIIQESLTNVRKHAHTNKANLLFTDHDDEVQVVISDEGAGFDLAMVNSNEVREHFGLTIMHERAEKVGGTLRVRSKRGEGTQIILRLPKILQVNPEEAIKGLRVIIADDHQLYLDGLHNLLRTRGVQVVGVAQNGQEAQELAEKTQPDLILMDVDMPVCNGLEATRQIKTKWPEMKVVMLTAVEDEEKLFTALRYGASGYLLKSVEGPQFFQLLAAALHGETVLSPDLAAKVLTSFAQNPPSEKSLSEQPADEEKVTLTYRQEEVLELVVQGYTNQEIATQLNLSERTIKHHVSQILARFQLKSRYELAGYAADND